MILNLQKQAGRLQDFPKRSMHRKKEQRKKRSIRWLMNQQGRAFGTGKVQVVSGYAEQA